MKKELKKETVVRPLSALLLAALIALFSLYPVGIAVAVEGTDQEGTEVSDTTDPADTEGDEADTADADTTESFFDNPAQAAHASQLAESVALNDEAVQDAYADLQAAQAESDALSADASEAEKAAAAEKLADAEAAYQDALAAETGVQTTEIAAMRTDGLGWGEIAHELGVHPSVLGLGHGKGNKHRAGTADAMTAQTVTSTELAEATARNPKTGNAKGHGVGLQTGAHTPGTGLDGTAVASASKDKSERGNIAGAIGLGGGKGGSSSAGGGQGSGAGSSGSSGGGKGGGNSGGNSGGGNSGGGNSGGGHGGGNSGGGPGGGNGGGNGGGGGRK